MMLSEERIKPYKEFVRPYYAGKDPAHNFRHIERLIGRLTLLMEEISQPIDTDKLCFMACFHGLGKLLSNNSAFNSEVQTFLKNMSWTKEDIEDVFQGLSRHLTDPRSIEEKIVHDANYIETLGAFGIAKAFTTGGARGQALEVTADILEQGYLDKLTFQTPVGQRLAEERKGYTKEFLTRLRNEW